MTKTHPSGDNPESSNNKVSSTRRHEGQQTALWEDVYMSSSSSSDDDDDVTTNDEDFIKVEAPKSFSHNSVKRNTSRTSNGFALRRHTGTSNEFVSPSISNDYYSKTAQEYISFTDKNPTTYHVVDYFKQKLIANGFTYISEKEDWSKIDLKEKSLFFTTRSDTSLIAFTLGSNWTPSRGIGAIGSHVDSLAVKLKPNSKKSNIDGYELLGVAPYSGALSDVWFDRDLGIGGKIIYRNGNGKKFESTLLSSSPFPIARIPTLAPHFGAPSVGPFNKETQMVPIVGFASDTDEPASEEERKSPLYGRHSLKLLRYISNSIHVPVKDLVQIDLDLFDVQSATRGGLNGEYIFAPRVDDRLCSYTAIDSLIEFSKSTNLPDSDSLNVVALFDNEEIGSGTRQGAKGGLLDSAIDRLLSNLYSNEKEVVALKRQLFANSIILSADVTHLLNPNFKGAYLQNHYPLPNIGVTIKNDGNGHVVTDSVGLLLIEQIAAKNKDKIQMFHVRNDARSGSTIGPFVACATGARTIDVGIPQLSMHSIRATFGYKDVGLGISFFSGFYRYWRETYDAFGDL